MIDLIIAVDVCVSLFLSLVGSVGHVVVHVPDREPERHKHKPSAFLRPKPAGEGYGTGEMGPSENCVHSAVQ